MKNKAKLSAVELKTITMPKDVYYALVSLGLINDDFTTVPDIRTYNVGNSDYSKHVIQPWAIWQDYNLNPWDADIVKRVLRTKEGDSRRMDYKKIIHICQERIRQIEIENEIKGKKEEQNVHDTLREIDNTLSNL